jgi:hypothetical protein
MPIPSSQRLERAFTLLAAGRPIVSFAASSFKEAHELLREGWLRDDLSSHRSEGRPLWDGISKLSVRSSTAEESAALALAGTQGAPDEDILLAYLVELENPGGVC